MRSNNPRSTGTKLIASATAALAITGGITAIASLLPNGFIESRHIKDGTVRSLDIADGSVTGADIDEQSFIAEAANSADRAREAGHSETAGRLLGFARATVSAAGNLRSTDFGGTIAMQTNTPGRYVVTFDGPVLGCTLMAGVGHNDHVPVAGSASVWTAPPDLNSAGRAVTIETHAAGSGDTVPDPLPFTVIAVC